MEPQDGPDDFYERCFAPHVIEGKKQAFVKGPPGAGKSHILLRAEQDLKGLGCIVKEISLTHVACRRLKDVMTAYSFVHRYVLHGRYDGRLLIDEISMLPATILTVLEQLVNAGARFVCFGDFNQLPPPMN